MPCTDGTPMPAFGPSGSYEAELRSQVEQYRKDVEVYKGKIDSLTDMLCSLCRAMEDNGGALDIDFMPENITTWWEKHKAADTRKRKAEAKAKKLKDLKMKALSKLTKEEKLALGLFKRADIG